MSATVLHAIRVICVSGRDRVVFLQGQLTQDVSRAVNDATCLAGWADAKGRLLWAGQLFVRADSLCLLASADIAEALATRLRMYVLRAQVAVTLTELAILGIASEEGSHEAHHPSLPTDWQRLRLANDPGRHVLIGPASGCGPLLVALRLARGSPMDWQLRDIRAGLPEITPATSGAFVPQMVNLDLLDGISFTKGCYTGQEIVARTRYRGRVKRRMLRFATTGEPPPAGAPVFAGRGAVGEIVSAAAAGNGSELLAVIVLDDLPGPFYTDEARTQTLTQLPLPYPIPELAS
jgi:folate-binding protein YgfZ